MGFWLWVVANGLRNEVHTGVINANYAEHLQTFYVFEQKPKFQIYCNVG